MSLFGKKRRDTCRSDKEERAGFMPWDLQQGDIPEDVQAEYRKRMMEILRVENQTPADIKIGDIKSHKVFREFIQSSLRDWEDYDHVAQRTIENVIKHCPQALYASYVEDALYRTFNAGLYFGYAIDARISANWIAISRIHSAKQTRIIKRLERQMKTGQDTAATIAALKKNIEELQALANKGARFTKEPDELRAEAKNYAHKRKQQLLAEGETKNSANTIIRRELKNDNKYKSIFVDKNGKRWNVENWRKFLQLPKQSI